jgi:hypothetical protein
VDIVICPSRPARMIAVAALTLSAAPAAAQAVENLQVTGWVAPRCFAAAPASMSQDGIQGLAAVRCSGPRPALSVTTRDATSGVIVTRRIVEAAHHETRLSTAEGNLVIDVPEADAVEDRGPMEIVVSPVV